MGSDAGAAPLVGAPAAARAPAHGNGLNLGHVVLHGPVKEQGGFKSIFNEALLSNNKLKKTKKAMRAESPQKKAGSYEGHSYANT